MNFVVNPVEVGLLTESGKVTHKVDRIEPVQTTAKRSNSVNVDLGCDDPSLLPCVSFIPKKKTNDLSFASKEDVDKYRGFISFEEYQTLNEAPHYLKVKCGPNQKQRFEIAGVSYRRPLKNIFSDVRSEKYEESTYNSRYYNTLDNLEDEGEQKFELAFIVGYLPLLVPYVTYKCICQLRASDLSPPKQSSYGTKTKRFFYLKRMCSIELDDSLVFGYFKHMLIKECQNLGSIGRYDAVCLEYRKVYENYLTYHIQNGGHLNNEQLNNIQKQRNGKEFPSSGDHIDVNVIDYWITHQNIRGNLTNLSLIQQLCFLSNPIIGTIWSAIGEFKLLFELFPHLADYLFLICINALKAEMNGEMSLISELRKVKFKLQEPGRWKCCFESETLKLSYRIFGPLVCSEYEGSFDFDFSALTEDQKKELEMELRKSHNKSLCVAMRCQRRTLCDIEKKDPMIVTDDDEIPWSQLLDTLDYLNTKLEETKNTGFTINAYAYSISQHLGISEEDAQDTLNSLKKSGLLICVKEEIFKLGVNLGLQSKEINASIRNCELPESFCSIQRYHLYEESILYNMMKISARFKLLKRKIDRDLFGTIGISQDTNEDFQITSVLEEAKSVLKGLRSTQMSCVWATLAFPFLCIIGLPGTGKTETLKRIYQFHEIITPGSVAVGTYNGSMACKLKDRGILVANTIHDTIYQKKQIDRAILQDDVLNEEKDGTSDISTASKPLFSSECEKEELIRLKLWYTGVETFIWDEFSNAPDHLICELLSPSVFPNLKRVVFVFDPFQASPIKEGQMFEVLRTTMYKITTSNQEKLLNILKRPLPKNFPKFGGVILLDSNHRFSDQKGHLLYNDRILLSGQGNMIQQLKFNRISTSLSDSFSIFDLFGLWIEYSLGLIWFKTGYICENVDSLCSLISLLPSTSPKATPSQNKHNRLKKDISIGSLNVLCNRESLRRRCVESKRNFDQCVASITKTDLFSCTEIQIDSLPHGNNESSGNNIYCYHARLQKLKMANSWLRELTSVDKITSVNEMRFSVLKDLKFLGASGDLDPFTMYLLCNQFYDFKKMVSIMNVSFDRPKNYETVISKLHIEECQLLSLTNKECEIVNNICKSAFMTNLLLWASPNFISKEYRNIIWKTNEKFFRGHRIVIKQNKRASYLYRYELKEQADIVFENLKALKKSTDRSNSINGCSYPGSQPNCYYRTKVLELPKVSNGEFFYFVGTCAYWEKCILSENVLGFVQYKALLLTKLIRLYLKIVSGLGCICLIGKEAQCYLQCKVEATVSGVIVSDEPKIWDLHLSSLKSTLEVLRLYYVWISTRTEENAIRFVPGETDMFMEELVHKSSGKINRDSEAYIEIVSSSSFDNLESHIYDTLDRNRWISPSKYMKHQHYLGGNEFNQSVGVYFKDFVMNGPNSEEIEVEDISSQLQYDFLMDDDTVENGSELFRDPEYLVKKMRELCSTSWVSPGIFSSPKMACDIVLSAATYIEKYEQIGTISSWPGFSDYTETNVRKKASSHNREENMKFEQLRDSIDSGQVKKLVVLTKKPGGTYNEDVIYVPFHTKSCSVYDELPLDSIWDGWCITVDSSQGGEFHKTGLVIPTKSPISNRRSNQTSPSTSTSLFSSSQQKFNLSTTYKGFGLSHVHVPISRAQNQFILFGKLSDFVMMAQRDTEISKRSPAPLKFKLKMIYQREQKNEDTEHRVSKDNNKNDNYNNDNQKPNRKM